MKSTRLRQNCSIDVGQIFLNYRADLLLLQITNVTLFNVDQHFINNIVDSIITGYMYILLMILGWYNVTVVSTPRDSNLQLQGSEPSYAKF